MDSILRLVSDMQALEASWEREPFVSVDLGDFSDVFSAESAERLIATGLSLPLVRMSRQGEALPPGRFARSRDPNPRSNERIADPVKVARCVSEGATLVLEELQSHSPEVAGFTAAVARETGYQTDCTAFLTPSWSIGFGPHYDAASVIVRQVHGSKRWRVSAPPRHWPARRCRPADDLVTEQVLDVLLEEGQSLYIPRGFVHAGETGDSPSIHLSISLRSVTWGAVLKSAVDSAAGETEELREALPPAFSRLDREEILRARLAALCEYLVKLQWSDISDGGAAPGVFPPAAADYTPLAPGGLISALAGSRSRVGAAGRELV